LSVVCCKILNVVLSVCGVKTRPQKLLALNLTVYK
jgi:hypothetical protein